MKIHRRCKCGCGGLTNYGKVYIFNHHAFGNTYATGKKRSKKTRKKISLSQMGHKFSEEARKKMSITKLGNTNALGHKHSKETKKKMSLAKLNQSKETKKRISLSNIKYDPNYPYCDIWKDKEYKKDIRKNYCENLDCKNNYKRLNNHHIYLDKKRCAPNEVMTLCNPCHAILHRLLEIGKTKPVNPKDYIIINRPDHVSYIYKPTREIIKIKRKSC